MIWNLILRTDEVALDWIEAGYLWLMDRTGIYVGTLTFVGWTTPVLVAQIYRGTYWLDYVAVLVFALIGVSQYLAQSKRMHKKWNVDAERWRRSSTRAILTLVWVSFLPWDYVRRGIPEVASSLLTLAILYLWGVRLRDPEKPEKKISAKTISEGA